MIVFASEPVKQAIVFSLVHPCVCVCLINSWKITDRNWCNVVEMCPLEVIRIWWPLTVTFYLELLLVLDEKIAYNFITTRHHYMLCENSSKCWI